MRTSMTEASTPKRPSVTMRFHSCHLAVVELLQGGWAQKTGLSESTTDGVGTSPLRTSIWHLTEADLGIQNGGVHSRLPVGFESTPKRTSAPRTQQPLE